MKLHDEAANKALEGKTPGEMTTMINGHIKSTDPTRKPVRTARRLGSGDICIMASDEKEATALRESKKWMERLSSNARAVTKKYGILLHGVRTDALDTKELATAIKSIQNENAGTLSLDITWLGWFGMSKEGQTKRSLIIELASPEEANRAIEEGIVIGSMLHGCCVYNKQCRTGQCFECWQYGHVSILCPTRGRPTCGKCGGKHHHDDCKETTIKCAVCKGPHVAWSKVCEAKKKDMARMIEARLSTPTRFPCGKDHENHHLAE